MTSRTVSRRSERGGHLLDPVDHRAARASDRPAPQAQSRPSRRAKRSSSSRADDVERQFQPVGLLGIDGELQVVRLGECARARSGAARSSASTRARDIASKRGCSAESLTEMPGRAGAGPRCRRLRRSPRSRRHRRRNSCRHRRRCARPRPACRTNSETRRGMRARASASSMVCPSTKCEPISRIACRVAARTAGRPSRCTTPSRIVSGVSPGWMTRAATPSVQAEAETRSAVDLHVAVEPAPGGELVLDQPVGGRGVGHAQQRLGQHHQRQALLGRERIGVQKILDPAEPAGLGADRLDQCLARARRCGFPPRRRARRRSAMPPRDPRPAERTAREKSVAQNWARSFRQFILPRFGAGGGMATDRTQGERAIVPKSPGLRAPQFA